MHFFHLFDGSSTPRRLRRHPLLPPLPPPPPRQMIYISSFPSLAPFPPSLPPFLRAPLGLHSEWAAATVKEGDPTRDPKRRRSASYFQGHFSSAERQKKEEERDGGRSEFAFKAAVFPKLYKSITLADCPRNSRALTK